ncbi:MAG: hypothetical protein IT389_16130 [Nitrospira sp.]|nr:hypothetical protein [Nitrospira sp.]
MPRFSFITKKLWATGGLLLGTILVVSPVGAAPITFNFTGFVSDSGTHVSGNLPQYAPVTGSYTFNSLTSNTGSGTTGTYNGALSSFTATIGSYVVSLGATNTIQVINPLNLTSDAYKVSGAFTGNLPFSNSNTAPATFLLNLANPSTNQFSGVALPLSPPSLSSFATKELRLVFGTGNSRLVTVSLTSLTAVPLPAAVILFGAGLVALAGLGAGSWRQRKNGLAA